MGEKLVEALNDAGKLKTIPDFYKLTVEDISELDRQGIKNATKVLKEINNRKVITIAELLAGLNIRTLSVKRAEILEDNFGELDHILALKTKDIVGIEGFETTLATFIVTGLKIKANLIKDILKYVSLKKKVEGALTGKSFCFSGFRNPDLENQLKAKGGRIASGVNKKLDYLIVMNKNGSTSKIKKAKDYGINVLDTDDLHGILHNTLF
jgi:DNA ligase (NAD+)